MTWKRETGSFSKINKLKILAGGAALACLISLGISQTAYASEDTGDVNIIIIGEDGEEVEETQETGDASEVLDADSGSVISHDEVELDPDTGLPVSEDVSDDDELPTVTLTQDIIYDPNSSTFTETFGSGEGETVTCTAANGMITNSAVSMKIGSGITASVYKDGVEQTDMSLSSITDAGNYAVRLSSASGEDLGTYSFRIISSVSNILEYRLPETFTMDAVYLDDTSLVISESRVSFDKEGTYRVVYHNEMTDIQYTLDVTIDHTAPVLALTAVSEKNTAHSAVDISDQEAGTYLTVLFDGEEIETNGSLTTPGRYQLTLRDEAGNVTTYAFTIYMYLTVSSAVLVVVLVLCQIGLIAYIVVSRNKTRVR